MQISASSEKVLRVFLMETEKEFFVNEIIRATKLYPNSVHKSLLTLEKQRILKSRKSFKYRYFCLNRDYKNLRELEEIVGLKKESNKSRKYEWVKILNRQSSISFTMALCKSNVTNLNLIYGVSIPNHWTNGITYGVYYIKDELVSLGKKVSENAEEDNDFFKNDVKKCLEVGNRLINTAKEIPSNLTLSSDEKLTIILKKYYQDYLNIFPFVTVPHGIERYFETKIRELVKDEEMVKILLSPIYVKDEERDDALKLASYVQKKGFDELFCKSLEEHAHKYCWLSMWSIDSKPLSLDYFKSEIINILNKIKDVNKEIDRIKVEEENAEELLDITFKKIKASPLLKGLVNYLQKYIYLRTFRKNSICQSHYYHLPLLNEFAKRLDLTASEIRLLSYEEMILAMEKKIKLGDIKKLVRERNNAWAICMWQGKVKVIAGFKNIIEAAERLNITAISSSMQRTVVGSVASGGTVSGRVKVVRKLLEMNKVNVGDVLVTRMTTPDYVVAMRKAVAIVTDEGGITCHAAIVSREFGIPCIVGTKNATQILNDNDWVEVDAEKGVVRVIENVFLPEDVRIISGKTICDGKVRGKARVILDASDFTKIEEGDILIAPQTTPEYLSSLYKVKGFVVDEDSLTSHAVFYGKALRLPSIMGTNYARSVLKDGEIIELDATNGIIKRKTCRK